MIYACARLEYSLEYFSMAAHVKRKLAAFAGVVNTGFMAERKTNIFENRVGIKTFNTARPVPA